MAGFAWVVRFSGPPPDTCTLSFGFDCPMAL